VPASFEEAEARDGKANTHARPPAVALSVATYSVEPRLERLAPLWGNV
jgi:hypothetical protein